MIGRALKDLARPIRIRLSETYCPVCDKTDQGFDPLPDFYRQKFEEHGFKYLEQGEMTDLSTYSCRYCGASDRERLYAYWLLSQAKSLSDCSALHFAPEQSLSRMIQNRNLFASHQTADLEMTGVDYEVDLMNLPFSESSYDFFICSHVLEHVPDDRKAISELFRITKSGGRGILVAPIVMGLEESLEGTDDLTDEDRWRLFGQDDHVRLYAHDDYVNKIEESGFLLEQLGQDQLGRRAFEIMGLKSTSICYIVTKP